MTATQPAWNAFAQSIITMSNEDLGAVEGMAKWARANLPAEVVCLVPALDAIRGVAQAILADRLGVTVEDVQALIAAAEGDV